MDNSKQQPDGVKHDGLVADPLTFVSISNPPDCTPADEPKADDKPAGEAKADDMESNENAHSIHPEHVPKGDNGAQQPFITAGKGGDNDRAGNGDDHKGQHERAD